MRSGNLVGLALAGAIASAGGVRAGEGASTSTPTPTPTPTHRPEPLPPPVSRAVAVEPAGPAPLARSGETVVDPAATFEIELPARLADVRLVLLDATDAHVPARGTRELGSTTRLVLAPVAPLAPGSRYVLRLEGVTSRELRGGEQAFGPLSFALLAAGTPPPPEPKAKPQKKKRRRR
jgi:hypothetical protein